MTVDCAFVREQLPEYAAGALDGRDRAAIEKHLQVCAECRADADTYVEVADSVLALAPLGEPPVGFEAAVLDRISGAPNSRHPRRRAGLVLLAAAAALLVVGLGIGRFSAPAPEIRTAALQAEGDYVGKAWIHRGDPGWLYVDMHYADPGPILVEVVARGGATTQVGQLVLHDGHGVLGARSPVPVDTVRTIRMREADGTIVCQAVLG